GSYGESARLESSFLAASARQEVLHSRRSFPHGKWRCWAMPWLAWAAPTSYLSCLAASVDRRPCLKTWPSRRSLRSATPASLSGRRQLALFLTAPTSRQPSCFWRPPRSKTILDPPKRRRKISVTSFYSLLGTIQQLLKSSAWHWLKRRSA